MINEDFLGFINDNQLFQSTDRVLLAVSGGLDSVAMANLFHQVGQPFAIAHVNFCLRGTESDTDAVFVENIAIGYGVPFHLTRFDTLAVARQKGISIQMAARELRYTWFDQLRKEHAYACIATAHHQNDLLETLLLNLTRGTGLAGLHGIVARQNKLVRPLLFTNREQLAAYVTAQGLAYREDSSNADDKYARNRIRHHVVPVLTDLNPGLWQTLPRSVERFRAAETLMLAELDRSWQAVAQPFGMGVLLPTTKLTALPEVEFRLTAWLKPMGFTPEQARQLVNSLAQPAGQMIQSTTHRVVHERSGLLIETLPVQSDFHLTLTDWPDTPIKIAERFNLTVKVFEKPVAFRPSSSPNSADLDADRFTFPITIRPWTQGDKLRPLGLKGHKLVSDLLNDLKLSRTEREQTIILLSANEIAWVIGRRIDQRFRVTEQTKRIVRIEQSNE